MSSVFSYPNPVNEKAARLVAAMVVALSLTIILSGQLWLTTILAYGFLARVLTGPTLSPMGLLGTVLASRLGERRPVPGPAQTLRPSRWTGILGYRAGAALRGGPVAGGHGRLGHPICVCLAGGLSRILRGVLRLQSFDALGPDTAVGMRGVRHRSGPDDCLASRTGYLGVGYSLSVPGGRLAETRHDRPRRKQRES